MKKVLFLLVLLIGVFVLWPFTAFSSGIRLIAPAEESFLATESILIIGQVEGSRVGSQVSVIDNGLPAGSAPVRNGTFVHRMEMEEGRHEIVLEAPGIPSKTLKVFVGRQEGYRYHVALEEDSCVKCHDGASRALYGIGPVHNVICSRCHEVPVESGSVHGPVAAGSCTPCHDPHGSRMEGFLVASGRELCVTCHNQVYSRKHVQDRLNARCLECHTPHSSPVIDQRRQKNRSPARQTGAARLRTRTVSVTP